MNPSILRNLTSEQWEVLSGLIPAPKTGGRKRSVDMQAIVNAILYILFAGCAGANAPKRFSLFGKPCITIFDSGDRTEHGNALHERLRLWVRVSQNREPIALRSYSR